MPRFDSEKKNALEYYNDALQNQKIDQRVISILNIINAHNDYYTTSSCSGRILLLALAAPGAKNESEIIGKWHDTISSAQVNECILKWKNYKYLYFLAQSPIFHVVARDLKSALWLRNLGEAAGFKYSSIRSIKPVEHDRAPNKKHDTHNEKSHELNDYLDAKITVELLGTERLNMPIGIDNKIYVKDEYLNILVDLANSSISKAHIKVEQLDNILRDQLRDRYN